MSFKTFSSYSSPGVNHSNQKGTSFLVSGPLKSSHPDIVASPSAAVPAHSQDEWPLVTIYLQCSTAAANIFPFFEAVLRQSYPARKIHVCAVDTGLKEEMSRSLAEVKALLEDSLGGFDICQTARDPTGRLPAPALDAARGDFVLVISLETCLAKNALEIAVKAALASSANIAAWEFKQEASNVCEGALPSELEASRAYAYCALYRRSALAVIGGFAAGEPVGFDMELVYRLRDSGYRLVYCPGATYCRFSGKVAGAPGWRALAPGAFYDIFMRLRYGTILQRLGVSSVALAFFRWPFRAGRGKISRCGVIARLLRTVPRFVVSRARSSRVFPICGWNLDVFSSMKHRLTQPRSVGARHALVSIIVRTKKGREGFLRECLCSLAHQTWPNIEVIVVEDGQSGFAHAVVPHGSSGDAGIIQYVQTPRGGLSATGNAGMEAARGDYLAVLDDDNLLFPKHVERLVALLEGDRSLAGAYSACLQVETEIHSQDPFVYTERWRKRLARRAYAKSSLWADDYIPVTSMVFRRSFYERHGGFDIRLKAVEAWDLWIRFSLNAPFAAVKTASAICRISADRLARQQWQDVVEENQRLVRVKQESYKSKLPVTESLELPFVIS